MKYFISVLFILQATTGCTQSSGHGNFKEIQMIDSKSLVGKWESTDSLKHRIDFVETNYDLALISGTLQSPYHFYKDSLNRVSTSGYIANWPPFDCDLNFIDTTTLEVIFSQMGVASYKGRFRKLK